MTPGIHRNITDFDYFKLPYASKSALSYLMQSPYHLRRYLDGHKPAKTEAFAFGSAVDKFITRPAEFEQAIAIRPECDRRTKEGKATYEAFMATLGNRTEIKAEQATLLLGIKSALEAHPIASRLLAPRAVVDGKPTGDGLHDTQVTVIAELEGVMCRARLDGWSVLDGASVIWDLKTCADIEGIERDAIKYKYILQAAIYSLLMEVLDATAGREPRYRPFLFVFVQSEPDEVTGEHPVDILEFAQADVEAAKEQVRGWLRLWKRCQDANEWPRRSAARKIVTLSPWQVAALNPPEEAQ